MNYNAREADPRGGGARNPLVGTESEDQRKIQGRSVFQGGPWTHRVFGLMDRGRKSQRRHLERQEESRHGRSRDESKGFLEELGLKCLGSIYWVSLTSGIRAVWFKREDSRTTRILTKFLIPLPTLPERGITMPRLAGGRGHEA